MAFALTAGAGRLLVELGNLLLVLHQRVDARHGRPHARLHHVFGEFFLVEDHDFFHVAHAALQVLAQRHDLANHDGRARNGLQHAHLPALDALGDFDFALARQQRHGAHLAQVHAHRVVGLFQRAGRQVELDVFALFELEILVGAEFRAVQQVDALGADGRDQIVDVVGGGHLLRHHVVDVAVGQVALLFPGVDQVRDVVFEFVVNRQIIPALWVVFLGDQARPVLLRLIAVSALPVIPPNPLIASGMMRCWGKRFLQPPVPKRTKAQETSKERSSRSARMTHLRASAKRRRFQIIARNRMYRASGFAWFAREPQLMCGAKGRASSQRSIDYHISSRPSNDKSES